MLRTDSKETAKFNGPFFTDPTRKIYHALGMTESLERTPKGQPKPSYISPSIVLATMLSIWVKYLQSPVTFHLNPILYSEGP